MICLRRCLLLALGPVLTALLSSCDETVSVESFGGPAQGSTYSVKYMHSPELPDTPRLKAEVEAILAEIDQQVSGYRDDSLIEQFNRLAAGSCMVMPAAVLTLVATGERLHKDSAGAFDLTLRPLLDLWGFGPGAHGQHQLPSATALQQARARIGQQYLHIEGERLCKERDLQVDFNSIAAGYTVDRIVARLAELGLHSYLVEVTGELKYFHVGRLSQLFRGTGRALLAHPGPRQRGSDPAPSGGGYRCRAIDPDG
jgi:thiamine biosynthesis lipoprotein